MAHDTFREFPDFASAFEPQPPLTVGAYLPLLNPTEDAPEAITVVVGCLHKASNRREQVMALLRGRLGWRPQLVGCVALLAAKPEERPMDDLRDAVCRQSWVAPQLLVTLVLVGSPGDVAYGERCITDRRDHKAAAALAALIADPSGQLSEVAADDVEGGGDIARRWRSGIGVAFDDAGVPRSW